MDQHSYGNPAFQKHDPNFYVNYQNYNPSEYPLRAESHNQNSISRTGSSDTQVLVSPPSSSYPPANQLSYPLAGPTPKLPESQSRSVQDLENVHVEGQKPYMNPFAENIPLQSHTQFASRNDADNTNHEYEAPIPSPGIRRHHQNKFGDGFLSFLNTNVGGRIPWVTYTLTLIQSIVFIIEIIKNAQLTGSPVEIQPSFNPMIGPSPYVLINMGARYTPCMHSVEGLQTRITGGEINWPCPNTTSNDIANCQLNNLCGFDMPASQNPVYPGQNIPLNQFPNQPNQWFRFIIPIFLHAGLVHIGFNMLLQMTLGKEMEVAIGPIRFILVYMCSGIFGFVLGGNFAASGIASTGASGALFGILALNLLDLFYTWGERRNPMKDFAYIMLDIIISFVLGLLPGLDNFSHIGGFIMGLVLGICILHSPNALRQRIDHRAPPYALRQRIDHGAPPYARISKIKYNYDDRTAIGNTSFLSSPIDFFAGRRPAWWAWWLVRVGSLVFVFIVFILLLKNFYTFRRSCSWCKYLSCIDINNWCDIGNLQLTTTYSPTKRSSYF